MKIYHHNDADGRAAGAVIYRDNKKHHKEIDTIEVEYDSKIDTGKIKLKELIFIVDFSFKPEIMEEVFKRTKNVIWIDHHKTAFEYKYSVKLLGIRDSKFSGCELAWQYCYPHSIMPRALELIGDRDKWSWLLGEHTANFNMGLRLYPHQPKDSIWDSLLPYPIGQLGNDPQSLIKQIEKKGAICLQFRDQFCKDYVNAYGFETEFEGRKCFALGLYMFGSEAFGDRMKKYDICISHVFVKDHWLIGLYSDKKDIDVSKIAQKYGGGGHHGASGFSCNKLPFARNINLQNKSNK